MCPTRSCRPVRRFLYIHDRLTRGFRTLSVFTGTAHHYIITTDSWEGLPITCWRREFCAPTANAIASTRSEDFHSRSNPFNSSDFISKLLSHSLRVRLNKKKVIPIKMAGGGFFRSDALIHENSWYLRHLGIQGSKLNAGCTVVIDPQSMIISVCWICLCVYEAKWSSNQIWFQATAFPDISVFCPTDLANFYCVQPHRIESYLAKYWEIKQV